MAALLRGAAKTLNPKTAALHCAAMRCCQTVCMLATGPHCIQREDEKAQLQQLQLQQLQLQLHLYDIRLLTAAGGSEGEGQGSAKVERQGGGGQVAWRGRSGEDACQGCAEP